MDEKRAGADWLVAFMQAREQESARISRTLHDEVGQILSAAGLQLDLLRMDCVQVAGVVERVAEAQKLLEQAVAQVRDLSYALNPSIVERAGLNFALDRLVGRYRKTFPGSVRLLFDSSVHVPLEIARPMYKIAEQALENAVEHSRCTHIEVLFRRKGNTVSLEIRDDGCGFPVDEVRSRSGGLGLRLMDYHASEAGLQLSLASEPEKGTIVKAIYRALKRPGDPSPRTPGGEISPGTPG